MSRRILIYLLSQPALLAAVLVTGPRAWCRSLHAGLGFCGVLICGQGGLPWPGSPQNTQIKVSLGVKSMCRGVLALWPPSAD